jgi:NAD(P)-dependent dehydrogenase (short-subunit alcohol dehydrogenase family)
MNLEGRKAVVTGAAQGIGRGIATELARAGCDVAIGDLLSRPKTHEAAAGTVSRIEALGRRGFAIECDVAVDAACEGLMRDANEALGGIDILVCNAGIMQVGGVADITSEQWRRILDVNLTGTFQCCKAALPYMDRGASIVNIASTTGLRTGPERVAYSSSKFGVVGLTQSLASECAPKGVRVNCVAPSFVRSEMTLQELMANTGISDVEQADQAWTKVGQNIGPLGRSVEPEDIGRAVVWLCESDMVIGIALPVTGGSGLPGL